eukprot:29153_1
MSVLCKIDKILNQLNEQKSSTLSPHTTKATELNQNTNIKAKPSISLQHANELLTFPLNCIDKEYPNCIKKCAPSSLHPAFYGCYDWHSCVHAHWSLIRLINIYPNINNKDEIITTLKRHISKHNITAEVKYLQHNPNFEKMYGWAWLLKLAAEIHISTHSVSDILQQNLQPLVSLIVENIEQFLPKLQCPIRCGSHSNTAFAMTLIYDYAVTFGNQQLKSLIVTRAKHYFMKDCKCNIDQEPRGYDFLSPCLEEANIMSRVLEEYMFRKWIQKFLPQLKDKHFMMDVVTVSDYDRKHPLSSHLYGLNFSRAWCLYGIVEVLPEYVHLRKIANGLINASLSCLKEVDYMGSHWLATFALLAQTL